MSNAFSLFDELPPAPITDGISRLRAKRWWNSARAKGWLKTAAAASLLLVAVCLAASFFGNRGDGEPNVAQLAGEKSNGTQPTGKKSNGEKPAAEKPKGPQANGEKHAAPEHKTPSGPPAERAANYEDALARAKTIGKDIVVLQRGSDWNRLGETLYNDVWLTDEFALELGDKFILADVDHTETVGGRPLPSLTSAASVEGMDFSDMPQSRLAKATAEAAPLPDNEVISVLSKEGAAFKQRTDGTGWPATRIPIRTR